MIAPALLTLLPALALAAPAPNVPRRTTALVIPSRPDVDATAAMLEQAISGALAQAEDLGFASREQLLPPLSDAAAEAAKVRAEALYKEARAAFESKNLGVAEQKLRIALREYHASAAALTDIENLKDARLMMGAIAQARGDTDEARLAILDYLALAPDDPLNKKRFSPEYVVLRSQVAASPAAQLRGGLTVQSRPAGASVHVDGRLMGSAPVTLQALPVGRHLLRLEYPGFRSYGAIVEVTPDDITISPELTPGPAQVALAPLLMNALSELAAERAGPSVRTIGRQLNVDQLVLGAVTTEGARITMDVALFDLRTGRRTGFKRANFSGDEYGQLPNEVARVVSTLFEGGAKKKRRSSGDPLDQHSGTEEWGGGERPKPKDAKGRRTGDGLDAKDGTEDW